MKRPPNRAAFPEGSHGNLPTLENFLDEQLVGGRIDRQLLVVDLGHGLWPLQTGEFLSHLLLRGPPPLQLLLTGLNAIIFVYLYSVILQGRFGKLGKKSRITLGDVKVTFTKTSSV